MSGSEIIAAVLMCAGTLCVLIGVLAFFRLPDFYSRLHATSVIETLAAILLLTGLMVHLGWGAPMAKLLLVLLLLLVLNPFSTNALAQAALHGGLQPQQK
ncbi:MAG: monovalent cation/H(+) antiporter subunit G [Candidatus Porifericomitaceae bacterium WSBS_2022_MAG_OTU9]